MVSLAAIAMLGFASPAGAARLYFSGKASASDGASVSGTFHSTVKVDASRAPSGKTLCEAYADSAFASPPFANGKPTNFLPAVKASSGDLELDGQTLGWFSSGPGKTTVTENNSDATGWFGGNQPFAIFKSGTQVSSRVTTPVSYTISLKRNGSGSLVESSPHSYVVEWTCSAEPESTLSGVVRTSEGQPAPDEKVEASGDGRTETTSTDRNGEYLFALPKGSYRVSVVGPAKPPFQTVDLQANTSGVNFTLKAEHLSVSFDPPTVKDNGLGFARLVVKVTDAQGKPVAGRVLDVLPGQTESGASTLPPSPDPAVVCSLDGKRVSPGFIRAGPFNYLYKEARLHLMTTDDRGTATELVFAGQKEDFRVTVDDAYSQPQEVEKTLTLTPVGGGFTPTPAQLRRFNDGELSNLADASTAQAQTTLLEWLLQLDARGIGPTTFAPVTANGAGAIAFGEGVLNEDYMPNAEHSVAHYGGESASILDYQLARAIAAPFDLGVLPDRLPTVTEWENNHARYGGLATGSVETGHEPLTDGDFLTYFDVQPYPPADLRLRAIFERCVPELARPAVYIVVFSPVNVSFVDGNGRQLGFDAHGKRHLNLPGGFVLPGHPQMFMVPRGKYTAQLTATGTGNATLVFNYLQKKGVEATRVFTLSVKRGQTGTLRLNGSGPAAVLRFGGRRYRATNGLTIRVRGLPRRLGRGRKQTRTVRIVDQVGQPVIDASLTITGRGLHIVAVPDRKGRVRVSLRGVAGGLRAKVSALGYRPVRLRIAVR